MALVAVSLAGKYVNSRFICIIFIFLLFYAASHPQKNHFLLG